MELPLLTPLDLSVCTDGRHGQGCDGSDHTGHQDDGGGQSHACLSYDPGQAQEEHHPPDVEEASYLGNGGLKHIHHTIHGQ